MPAARRRALGLASPRALGGVRSGGNRTADIVRELRAELQTQIAAAIQQPADAVGISLIGVPSNWIVEGGEIMPAPGDEDAWLERKHAQEPAQ